ncbi:MAG: restriction endonuclease subunit S [Bacteroidetes bacterium]|nr:restriction endonuclease subunit S [Bacteroidota bacterium]
MTNTKPNIKSVPSKNPSQSVIQTTNNTFKKYPAYKKSGEYWMGLIPKHWVLKKLKHVFQEKKKVNNPELPCGSISYGKVVYKDDEKIPESTKASYQEVLAGEFLINPLNLNYDLVSLRIGLSQINVVVSSGYIVLKNVIELNKSYFNYLLHRYDVAYMKLLGSGVRQTISFNHIANSLLAFPPLPEQTAIAAFLDDKTSKIDRAIAQKEKMIALLKERKQIIIQNAVTKGLDPNAKMKDSGVEWIGEVPEGWEVRRLKYVSKININSLPENTPWSFTFDYVDIGSVSFENGIERTEYFEFKNAPSRARRIAKKGNTVISTVRTYLKAIDYISEDKAGFIYSTGFAVLEPIGLADEFLFHFLRSNAFTEQVTMDSKGMSYPAINSTDLSRLFLAIPPMQEQNAIIVHIETQSVKIEKAIKLQEQQIEKLKELKSTLIDSAVTGKIKVTLES